MTVNVIVQGPTGYVEFADISAIVFDKDGTLARVDTYLRHLYHARLKQLAILPSPQLDGYFGVVADNVDPVGLLAVGSRWENETVLAAYLCNQGHGWISARQRVQAGFIAAASTLPDKASQTPLVPGVDSLLRQLQSASLQLAIATADTQAAANGFVQHYQLSSVFSYWQGVTPQWPDKTAAGFLDHICLQMGVPVDRVLVCGDSASDWLMAETAGAAGFIGFQGGWPLSYTLQPPRVTQTLLPYVIVNQLYQSDVRVDE